MTARRPDGWWLSLLCTAAASAVYGFAVGHVHSTLFGLRNLIKFPALLLATAAVCAVAYYLVAHLAGARLSFTAVQRLALGLFRDTAVLLAGLGPACYFLARTLDRPDALGLNGYPLFLGLNVLFIAACGAAALVRQARGLLRDSGLSRGRCLVVTAAWLLLSLLVGGQWAWYLRPFFGVASIAADQTPFYLGTDPDFRGATSFYEAVYHLVSPP